MIRRQLASGLSVARVCRQSGVAASSLFAWKRRLGGVGIAATAPFVEARIVEGGGAGVVSAAGSPLAGSRAADSSVTGAPGAGSAADPDGAWWADVIEIRLRCGRRVRVGRGFDRGLLAEVIATLEGLS